MLKESALVNRCYILRERLGEDSFCEKWRVSAIFSAADFLLRVVKPEYAVLVDQSERFTTDAWNCYEIAAPSILPLIEIDRVEDRPFIVSEYAGYTDFRSELNAGLAVTLEHACRFAIEMAEGIDAFHQKERPYGVLTPESIAVRRSGGSIVELRLQKPTYLPFFSVVPDNEVADVRDNWGYAAPELKRGERPIFASDIYSLGVFLYRLIAGKIPYGTRAGLRIKERSASPGFVAISLARRNVPRDVAAIVVRSLRKNPALRYPDAVSLIADLRVFLDARREATIRSGGVDPIADIATLNLKKAKAGAHEIVRSLDTVDYFRIISEAAISNQERTELMEMISTIAVTPEIAELEELEDEWEEDDDTRTVESFIEESYATHIQRPSTPAATRESNAAPAVTSPTTPSETSTTQAATPPALETPIDKNKGGIQSPPIAELPGGPEAPSPVQVPSQADKGPIWSRSGGSPDAIAKILAVDLRHARKGRGSFRFIEDPGTGVAAQIIDRAIDSWKKSALVIELGTLPATESLGLIGRSLVEHLSPKSALHAWDGTAKGIAEILRTAARRSRPVALIGYGAEKIDRTTHDLFASLAEIAHQMPIIVLLFYEKRGVERWHALWTITTEPPRN